MKTYPAPGPPPDPGNAAALFTAAAFIAATIWTVVLTVGYAALVPAGLLVSVAGGLVVLAWSLAAGQRYRIGRQLELSHLLLTAVESGVPLAPALRAYADDGRRHPVGQALLVCGAVFLMLLFPLAAFAAAWHATRLFDVQVRQFADRLEAGDRPTEAARHVPGLLPKEVLVALRVGEATGKLPECLRRARSDSARDTWAELFQAATYPIVMLTVVGFITTFVAVAIIPKFKRIFDEFGLQLPPATLALIDASDWVADYRIEALFLAMLGAPVVIYLLSRSGVLWRTPGLRRFYRANWQGVSLRLVAVSLASGATVPAALRLIAFEPSLPRTVRRRLDLAADATERGEPLADALRRTGLLPGSMDAFVRTAETTRTLPEALEQLGEHRSGTALRTARRLAALSAPLSALGLGALIGFIALGLFSPLVKLLEGLST